MSEPTKPPLKDRLKALLEAYGPIGVVIYFAIFALVFAGFVIAIRAGAHVESRGGGVGTLGVAYFATKVTQPLRILATLVLTPIVGKLFGRKHPDSQP